MLKRVAELECNDGRIVKSVNYLKGGAKTHLLGQGYNLTESIETDQAQFTVPQWDDIVWRLSAFFKSHAVELYYNEGLDRPFKVETFKA